LSAFLAPSKGKTPAASKTLKKKWVTGIALKRILEGLEDLECRTCGWLGCPAEKSERVFPGHGVLPIKTC
jgi:hypothetical protein